MTLDDLRQQEGEKSLFVEQLHKIEISFDRMSDLEATHSNNSAVLLDQYTIPSLDDNTQRNRSVRTKIGLK